jgi:hypothetical protein
VRARCWCPSWRRSRQPAAFRLRTRELAREGFDLSKVSDVLYLYDAGSAEHVRLDAPLYESIVSARTASSQ